MKKRIALIFLPAFMASCISVTSGLAYGAAAQSAANVKDSAAREIMAERVSEGITAHNNKQFQKACSLLQPAAAAGNPNAQYYMGICYDFGRGVKTNHEEANAWYRKAAEQGQDDAQFNLGMSYQMGEGIEQDDKMAVYWFSQAAAHGDEDAWDILHKYAEDDVAEAQYALAHIYNNGVELHNDLSLYPDEDDNIEIIPDPEQFQYWLKRAGQDGPSKAAAEIAGE
jgi:TPR repeat protein